MIALDTETCLIAPGLQAPPIVCLSTSDGTLLHRTDDWAGYVRSLPAFVGHNVAYDCAVMAAARPDMLPGLFEMYASDLITDTMLRAKLLDIADGTYWSMRAPRGPGYSLGALAKRCLGIDLDKSTVRLRYSEMYDIPVAQWPEAFREYAVTDAVVTLKLYEFQEARVDLLADQYRQARAAWWIQLMKCWGLTPDLRRVEQLRQSLQTRHDVAATKLLTNGLIRAQKHKGVSVLVRDTKAAGSRLVYAYAALGREHPTTDGGAPELSREACETSGDDALKSYAEYSQLNALLAKDIPALSHPILHSYFDSLVDSGRTSSSGPNVQNFPRRGGFRECLVPRPGHIYIVADYKSFELVTLAQVCMRLLGRSRLAEALNAGADPHMQIAAEILGRSVESCTAHRKDRDVDDARQTGKVLNFGCPGGLGAPALVHFAKQNYNVELSEERAKDLKYRVWLPSWPEMRDYFNLIGNVVETRGAIEQIFSGRLRGGVGFTDACNTLFQGLAADIAKAAGFVVSRECYIGSLAPSRIVNFVHDELVLECPEPLASTHARIIERIMIAEALPWLPDVKLGVDVSAMRRYSKDPAPEDRVTL